MKLYDLLDRQSKPLATINGLLLVILLGLIDFHLSWQYALSVLYVVPVAWVAYYVGMWPALLLSVVSAGWWFWVDVATKAPYAHPMSHVWNLCVRFSLFCLTAMLLSYMKDTKERYRELANTDSLTGTFNRRHFDAVLAMEIARTQRYHRPFTVAYLDLDNFKVVNDRLGHAVGDRALCLVADLIRDHIRTSDILARMGGDEFALLLPETGAEGANVALDKVRGLLQMAATAQGWPITFSVGAISFAKPPGTTEEIMNRVDAIMYEAKQDGKNTLRLASYP